MCWGCLRGIRLQGRADVCAGGAVAVLVYDDGREAADGELVEAGIDGVVCAGVDEGAGRQICGLRGPRSCLRMTEAGGSVSDRVGAERARGGDHDGARRQARDGVRGGNATGRRGADDGVDASRISARLWVGGASDGRGFAVLQALPLARHGLHWIHGAAPLAHPLDDGSAVMLERDMDDAASALGKDGGAWRTLVEPLVSHWEDFTADALGPVIHVPHAPLRMARFGWNAMQPARGLAESRFLRSGRARCLRGWRRIPFWRWSSG